MESLQKEFEESANAVRSALTKRPTDNELLTLYAAYKQATIGDNNTEKPSLLDLKGKRKWETWSELKGITPDEAKRRYIDQVKQLVQKYA